MKKEIYFILGVAISGIIIGELLIFSKQTFVGLGIHIINLLAIIFIIIFSSMKLEEKNVLQSLTLVILLRIINLSVPQLFTVELLQYSLIYGVIFISIYLTIKNQNISSKDLGVNFQKLYIYIPVAVIIGSVVAMIEYRILGPIPLIGAIRPTDIILISIVMFIFIAPVEETIFRSILQTRLEKIFGMRYGILLSGSIFGVMHSGYGIAAEILFATIFGIIVGYFFYKTKNLPFVISIHGTVNVMLFGILPKVLT